MLFAQEIFDAIFLPMVEETLYLILTLSAPMLLAAIITGIAISIFQATTKVQEQTLSFIPKIVATFYALVAYVPTVKMEAETFLMKTLDYIGHMQVDAVLK